MVIDPGLPVVARKTLEVISNELDRTEANVSSVACTHGHPDHVGGVAALTQGCNPNISLPQRCEAYLAGEKPRTFPLIESSLRFMAVWGEQEFARDALLEFAKLGKSVGFGGPEMIDLDFEPTGFLVDGATLDGAPGWEVIHSPGHTDDSTCFYHADSSTLISGDAPRSPTSACASHTGGSLAARIRAMSALPPAGWYDDPENFGYLRYWDGSIWTEHRSPTGGYGQGAGSGQLSDIGSWLEQAFKSIWARRGPMAILGAAALALALAVGLSARSAFGDAVYENGQWSGVDSGGVGLLIIVAALAMLFSVILYLAATHQLYEYHLGREVGLGDSMGVAFGAFLRLLLWSLLAAAIAIAALVVVGLIIAFAGPVAILLVLAAIPFGVWLWVKLSFFVVACVAPIKDQNPFTSSAQVSQDRFWPVLGRLLLASIIGFALYWAVSLPLSVAGPTAAPDLEDTIIIDGATDEIVYFHVGDTLDELGLSGGLIVLLAVIPQLINTAFGLATVVGPYADIQGRHHRA